MSGITNYHTSVTKFTRPKVRLSALVLYQTVTVMLTAVVSSASLHPEQELSYLQCLLCGVFNLLL